MKRYYRHFFILLFLVLVLTDLCRTTSIYLLRWRYRGLELSSYTDNTKSYQHTTSHDAESLLALGEKITFSRAGQYELELLPGVGSVLAKNILISKSLIAQQFSQKGQKALKFAKGIGDKRAKLLGHYLK